MNRFKFNNGNGALVCNKCDRIIQAPISPEEAKTRYKESCIRCESSNFYNKYPHIGYAVLSVPDPWKPIVKKALIAIEKEIWPRWIPMFIKRRIHYLATGNSVVRIKSRFWDKINRSITKGMLVTDVKDKYAGLCIYGYFNDRCDKIVDMAEEECANTCEKCGSTTDVQVRNNYGWYVNFCEECHIKYKTQNFNDSDLP